MAHLIPPMDDEPPPEFVAFVATRLTALRSEAARLLGGDHSAPEISMQVLTDLAGHWRWLTWRGRLTHQDAAGDYLDRRLTARTRQWREDQIYPVEVNVLSAHTPDRNLMQFRTRSTPPAETVAQQLATLLPSTIRRGSEEVADAGIAWVHAYRRYLWHHYWRVGAGTILLIGALVQLMSQFSATP